MSIYPYGRKKEIELLNKRFESDRFEFGYLYGQRRIGKSTLLSMFCKNKKSLYFYATDSSDIDIRVSFSNTLNEAKNDIGGFYQSWFTFFQALDSYVGDDKVVVCIDEFPNILLGRDGKRKNTDFDSSLQKAIDLLFIKRKFTLILTGSNVSFLNKEIVNSKAPLFQRNTFSIRLEKFEFNEALIGFKDIKDNFEKAKFLCLTNTFPYYISLIDVSKTFEDNLDNLFFNKDAVFVDDPSKVITSDIITSGLYASLIKHISNGFDTVKSLSDVLEMESAKISKYLKELLNSSVVIKRNSFQNSKHVHYEILDPMLAFYYRFIRDNKELIHQGYGQVIKKRIKYAIDDFINRAFEKLCLTYLEYLSKNLKLDGLFLEFENFAFVSKKLNRTVEIDIISKDKNALLVAETKLSVNKRTIKDYLNMLDDLKAEIFIPFKKIYLYLFGTNGFTDELKSVNDNRLHLIDLETMFNTNKIE